MSYLLEIEIPDLPKTYNAISKRSFWTRVNENKKWLKLVFIYSHCRTPSEPLTKAIVTLTRMSSREPDADGLYSSFKSVLDALKNNHIILDDKPSVIDLKCLWEKAKRKEGKIKVKVEAA